MKKLAILSLVAIVISSCGSKEDKVLPVRDTVIETVFASGTIDANVRYQLTAQVDGYLKNMSAAEGDYLNVNDVFVQIDNPGNISNANSAEQQLAIAVANLTESAPAVAELNENIRLAEEKLKMEQKNVERYRALRLSNSVSPVELENAELAKQTAESNLNALKEKLRLVKQQAKQAEISQRALAEVNDNVSTYNTVRIPVAGTCIRINKKNGDFVKKGDIIAEIADLSSLVAKLNVDETVVNKIKIGQQANVSLNVDEQAIKKAKVSKLYPMYDEASQSYWCDLVFDDSLAFAAIGTRLQANIVIGKKENALLIPRAYLSYANTVQVKGEDSVRTVKVGIKGTEWVEIIDGLNGDEELAMHKK